MRYYPIFMDLRGRPCVVVGGGRVAERKVKALLRAGASVHVISPEVTPRLALLAAKKKIGLTRRTYRKGDLKVGGKNVATSIGYQASLATGVKHLGPLLVFAATDDPEVQRAIRRDAEEAGALLNAADDAPHSNFIVPASFAQGELLVAISTSGASPALARRLRRQLQLTLGRDYRAYVRLLREARKQIKETVPDKAQRANILRELSGASVVDRMYGMAQNYKELQAKMAPASLRDNKRRVREEVKVFPWLAPWAK